MRIVFFNPIGELGGAELFLLEMMQQIRRDSPDWELHLVTAADGPLLKRAVDSGVQATCLPWSPRLAGLGDSSAHHAGGSQLLLRCRQFWGLVRGGSEALSYTRRFNRLMKKLQPDLIHSNGMKCHVISGLSRLPIPTVWFMHDYLQCRRLMRRVLPCLSGRVTRLIANSQSVADDVAPLMPRLPIDVVYPGVDETRFYTAPGMPARLDQLAGLPATGEEIVRIGLVATYARWKGQDVFLQAAAQLKDHPVKLRFYIVGGPIYAAVSSQFTLDELRDLAADQGVDATVGFIPFQEEPAWIYRTLDIVVHASRQPEPFGRSILEAMACGRSVVAANVGGAAEIYEENVSAVGVRPGSAMELASLLNRLISDPAHREILAIAAAERAKTFTQLVMGQELRRIYEASSNAGKMIGSRVQHPG